MPVTSRDHHRPETDRQAGGERADAINQDRDHQQRLAAKAIGQRAAEQPADCRKGQRGAEENRDVALPECEIGRERRRSDHEAEKQQIVEIENPADE
jgi:hypothetical protein